MSDEQRKDEETEVEGHVRYGNDEPLAEGEDENEVEAHSRLDSRLDARTDARTDVRAD
jgi:hypothetical protein